MEWSLLLGTSVCTYIYIYIRSDSVSDVETVSCSNNIVDIQFFWFSCLLFISFGLEFYSLKLS
jgi:hypothetical protein